jgi:hypothetical protein
MWLQPTLATCLEFVKDGKLGVEDAILTMERWGMMRFERGEWARGKHDDEVVGGKDEVDQGVLMNLLKGLGLQEPPVDNVAEGVVESQVEGRDEVDDGENGAVKPDMSEILAMENQEIQTGSDLATRQTDEDAEAMPSGLEGILKMFGGSGAGGDNADAQGQPDMSSILSMLQNPEIMGLLGSLAGGNGGGLDGIMGMFGSNMQDQVEDVDEDAEDNENALADEQPPSLERLPLFHNNPAAAHAKLGEPEDTRDPIDPETETIPTEILDRNATQIVNNGTQLNSVDTDDDDDWVVVDSTEMEDEWVAETPEEEFR